MQFFTNRADTDQALDMIDLSFRYTVVMTLDIGWKLNFEITSQSGQAITDLNTRFREHGLGYEFIDDEESPGLIRKDNEHLHREAVVPAFRLLHEEGFQGANEEYRTAHEHYCHRRNKECLNDCLKAFESTMKTICKKKNWKYKETDTASALIEVCIKKNLFPASMQSHLGTVRSALESAIPTLRNKMGHTGRVNCPKTFRSLMRNTCSTKQPLLSCFW
jgi:hypothetical protein